MKKYPKILQADTRGQIVIPKDVRNALGIDENTGFYLYAIPEEGIFLKQITPEELPNYTKELEENAEKIGVNKKNIKKAHKHYKQTPRGLEEL
ncbi:MAG: AbrB/MazE/SpoVT family DNA-binding domain-containing protein [Candidatus Woesearchaeota archaeon]